VNIRFSLNISIIFEFEEVFLRVVIKYHTGARNQNNKIRYQPGRENFAKNSVNISLIPGSIYTHKLNPNNPTTPKTYFLFLYGKNKSSAGRNAKNIYHISVYSPH